MVIEKELLGLNEVAELCEVSKNVISNWRKRDDNFPRPYQENVSGPIWKSEDIVQYLAYKDAFYDAITSACGYMKTLRIALIGRARDGKTYIISRLVKNRLNYIKLFCGGGEDETFCVVYNTISEDVKIDFFEFHTDFNSIYKAEDNNDELKDVNEEISRFINIKVEFDDVDKAKEKILEIKRLTKRIKEIENKYPNRKCSQTFINVYLRPNDYCKDILRSTQAGRMEIIDTPGVSGDVEASDFEKSDVYIFVLKPENRTEAQTIKKIVVKIKPDVATSKVLFLYRKEKYINTIQKYEKASLEAKNDMKDFNNIFSDLRGNIISTDIELLDPAANCILYPTMDDEDVVLTEEIFMKEFCEKLKRSMGDKSEVELLGRVRSIIDEHREEALTLTRSILNEIQMHELTDGKNNYTKEDFLQETHDRVMTNDNYRIRQNLRNAYRRESVLLDSYFSKYMPEEYPEEWQQALIKYMYRMLMKSIRTDRGLGIGTHPFEEKPARTMLVEESICAAEVLKNISGMDRWATNQPYRAALQECGIVSKTWGYVGCSDNKEALIKLRIIKESESKIQVSDRENLILARYIGGLRKTAQFLILIELGVSEEKCYKEVMDLPF